MGIKDDNWSSSTSPITILALLINYNGTSWLSGLFYEYRTAGSASNVE